MSSKQQAPPVLLTGPMLGGVVASLLTLTTTLYLNHDRESKEWDGGPNARQAKAGYWPAPSADFNWCELDYVYTPFVIELWNSVTSFCFLAGPMLLWSSAAGDREVQLNLLLVVAIGLGSAAFHGTLQYEHQLLDELPMICYIAHTTAIFARADSSCPNWLKASMLALSALLFGTPREALGHKAGRLVMVLSFSGCFVWLAFSLAAMCARLDACSGNDSYLFTRRYQSASLVVVLAITAWVSENLTCGALHNLPLGLPYPQLHAMVWHTGMAYVCHCLCVAVLGKRHQERAAKAK